MHKIGIIMGSDSDLRVMQDAARTCEQFHIAYELTIVSAHRTPERLLDYGKTAAARGLRVIIAGAGGAAHLPGMIAAVTPLPVIGVPIHSSNSIDGWDSVLSILQMPAGVPVATVALDGAKNAALLALRILGASDETLRNRLAAYQDEMRQSVLDKADALKNEYPCDYR
ncbi:5-(carboxyamino)imidazole ribonucleotide mutase [Cardiobacterium hominis]|uniref:N5-carboxyaminoimidazole ribonucleotide mutase n=1 Tax=Cardiobacterium hominis TaxID=2718 RepID=A0A1C3H5S1_9GAMM|nr:5-(carboxyamino)imidazole ribonucleotide mutase [Cardiobacterium hominis]SAM68472.1 Phosphoribosylaminoimidazole carboxylase catalytic subunit [Cardiobacterium hominis]